MTLSASLVYVVTPQTGRCGLFFFYKKKAGPFFFFFWQGGNVGPQMDDLHYLRLSMPSQTSALLTPNHLLWTKKSLLSASEAVFFFFFKPRFFPILTGAVGRRVTKEPKIIIFPPGWENFGQGKWWRGLGERTPSQLPMNERCQIHPSVPRDLRTKTTSGARGAYISNHAVIVHVPGWPLLSHPIPYLPTSLLFSSPPPPCPTAAAVAAGHPMVCGGSRVFLQPSVLGGSVLGGVSCVLHPSPP